MTKLNKRIGTLLVAITASSLMTACGTDGTTGVLSAANLDLNQKAQTFAELGELPEGFALNFAAGFGEEGQAGFGQRGQKGQRGMKGKKGPKAGFVQFGADLNLTDEQKEAFKALKEEAKTQAKAAHENINSENREKAKTIIQTAFVSDTFDVAALTTQLAEFKPDHSAKAKQKAEMMIKAHQILTAEQHAQIEAKKAERKAQAEERKGNRPERTQNVGEKDDKRLTMITEKLGLSTEQQEAFKALKPEKPDFEAVKAKRDATQEAVQAELKSDSPSADKIVALMEESKPEKPNRLDKLASIHSILTAEQRQAFVDLGMDAPPHKMGGKKGGKNHKMQGQKKGHGMKSGRQGPGGRQGGFGK